MNSFDPFLNPVCLPSNLDYAPVRRAILNELKSQLPRFHGRVLDIGCGRMPYKNLILSSPSGATSYTGLDLPNNDYGAPDLEWDGKGIPLGPNTVDVALATQVLEHTPDPEAIMREVARVLTPGGLFFFTVPFFWPLHCVPNDEYRYTPFALKRHLEQAGLTDIHLKGLGGWDASLAQMIGLWVRRRPLAPHWRKAFSFLAFPIVRFLASRDKPPTEFSEQTMWTEIAGTALKPRQ